MRAIYRAAFTLKSDPSNSALNLVSDLVFQWVLDPERYKKRGNQPSLTAPSSACSMGLTQIMPGWDVQAHRVDSERQQAWGFRLTHPDSEDPRLTWATEVTVIEKGDAPPFFTCSLLVGDNSQFFVPIKRRPSRPRIVADVLEKIGGNSLLDGRKAFPLLTRPMDLSESDRDREIYLKALASHERTHPIVLISVDNHTEKPLVDHLSIASHLAGLAHVVLARNSDVSWNLRRYLPQHLNCYHGAVRLYWPRLQFSDPSYQHPLWSPQQIELLGKLGTKEVSQQLLEKIAGISAFKMPEHFLTWDRLIELDRRKAIAEAKERALAEAEVSGKKNEWAELLEADNASQTAEIRALKEQLSAQAETLEKHRSLAESYRIAYEQERRQEKDAPQAEIPALPAATVHEAILNAQRDHSERLAFAFNSRSEEKNSLFHAPDEVERALNWLATTYFDSKTKVTPCPDLDANLTATIPGWHYSAHQKEATMKAHQSWYQCSWPCGPNGKIWIPEHLKGGADRSRRPEDTIRIAFAWVEEDKKVVVGFIGQHQENTKS